MTKRVRSEKWKEYYRKWASSPEGKKKVAANSRRYRQRLKARKDAALAPPDRV